MELTSKVFTSNEMIPRKYTCDGENISPPLAWSGVPDNTKSLALIVEDPDARSGIFTHWIVFGIPPDQTQLPENFQPGTIQRPGVMQGQNGFGNTGYGGPCPPSGPAHRYIFRLYALEQQPGLSPGASRGQFLDVIQDLVVAQAELVGRYSRG